MNEDAGRGVAMRRAFLVLLLSLLGIGAYVESPRSVVAPAYVASILAIVTAVLPLAWSRRSDPFEPLSYTAFYLAYSHLGILGALISEGDGALPHLPLGGDQRSRLAVASIGLNVLGFVAYALGYRIRAARAPAPASELPPASEPTWSRARFWSIAAVFTAISLAAYTAFQIRLGRPLFDFESLRAGKQVWRADVGSTWMQRGVLFVFVPIALAAARAFRHGSRRSVALSIAIALLAAVMLLRMGQRSASLFPLVAMAGMFHFLRRRISWTAIALGMIAVVEFTNISTSLRTGQTTRLSDAIATTEVSPLVAFGAHEGERGRLDSTAAILYFFPDRVSYLLGESWKPLLVVFVPRWLDPDKARGQEWSDTRLLHTLIGFPAPPPLTALVYANFSLLGVFVFMAGYGWFHANLYAWRERNPDDVSTTVLYMLTLIFFTPTPAGVSTTLQYVLPAFLMLKFVESRPTARPPAFPTARPLFRT